MRRLVSILALAVGCGGSPAPGPQPLKYHFKEQHIATIAVDQKKEMLEAKTEHDRAVQEKRNAAADYASSRTALDAARDQAQKARRQKDAATSRKSAARRSDDFERINLALRDERVAEVTLRAAEQKVEMLKARRAWQKTLLRFTEENVYATEARYELAKAKVARANNIAPSDFAFQAYVDQHEQRRRSADRTRVIADRDREKWQAAQVDFEARKRDENEARGVDTASASGTR
jgi:hypothetical protein